MYVGDIIRQYREENHMSLRAFAAKCRGISHGYLAALESGKNPNTEKPSQPSRDKLEAIARGMDMPYAKLDDLMNDRPVKFVYAPEPISLAPLADQILPSGIETFAYTPGRSMVPIVGSVRCGVGGLAYQDMQGSEVADVADPWHYFYLRVEGDSMAPAIQPGDLALVRIQPDIENGQLAVVIIDGEEGVLKKFKQEGNMVVLLSFNPSYEPRVFVGDEISRIKIAGRVMETKKKW